MCCPSRLSNGTKLPALESYDVPGQYHYADDALAQRYADLQMEAREARSQLWRGRSTVRTLRAGTRLTITRTPLQRLGEEAGYTILRVVSVGVNNLPSRAAEALAELFGRISELLHERCATCRRISTWRSLRPARPATRTASNKEGRIMRGASILLVMSLWVASSPSHTFDAAATQPAKYVVGNEKSIGAGGATANVSVQTLKIVAVEGMSAKGLNRINTQLGEKAKKLHSEIKLCSISAEGHPWGYEVKFEKILVSSKYVSVIFKKSTVCAGSPNLEKVALVFSRMDGKLISGTTLVKDFVPESANVVASGSLNEGKVRLDESSAERVLEDSESAAIDHDERCDFYLKTTSYSVWVDRQRLVLFPEFSQPNSFCQKEYVIESGK